MEKVDKMTNVEIATELMEAEFVSSFGSGAQLFFLASSNYFARNLPALQKLYDKWSTPELLSTLRHPFGVALLGRLLSSEQFRERLKDRGYAAMVAHNLAAFSAAGAPLP